MSWFGPKWKFNGCSVGQSKLGKPNELIDGVQLDN